MPAKIDRGSLDELFSLTYEELRRLANCVLQGERAAQITPTTLVNETWIKLAGSPAIAATSALHFRRIAGRAMRQVLVDAARRRLAEIHGGGLIRVTLDPGLAAGVPDAGRDVLALDAALDVLARCAPRQAELVEMRFFGGYSCVECAELLEVSEATVMREWRAARAFLGLEIRNSLGVPRPGTIGQETMRAD